MGMTIVAEFNGGNTIAGFPDLWLWLAFVVVGLVFVLLELIVGVETGLDLVIIGSAFIVGGLATWPSHSWVLTVIVTSIICIAYVALGRRYVHRWTQVKKTRTNIDAIIGRRGIVLQSIARHVDGLVKVGNEQWRARAEEDIKKGDEIVVISVSGVTLNVEKTKGGD
jgi:membrane protein implicated in regulation of membrane protease activity